MKFRGLASMVALLATLGLMLISMIAMMTGADSRQTIHGIVIPIFKGGAVMAIALAAWGAIFFPASWLLGKVNARCWFGHRKKWVAVYLFSSAHNRKTECPAEESHSSRNWYSSSAHWNVVQIGRWVCEREGCLGMGEKCFGDASKKRYTIELGKLVQDEKVWANPHAQQEVKS